MFLNLFKGLELSAKRNLIFSCVLRITKKMKIKIKTIFVVVAILTTLQMLPLAISLLSADFKAMLLADIFGENPSADTVKFFGNFAMVVGTLVIGLIFLLIGSMSFKDEATLRRLSFLYSVVWGFFCVPDLISFLTNDGMAAPLPVVIMGIVSFGLLLYGSKKGTA